MAGGVVALDGGACGRGAGWRVVVVEMVAADGLSKEEADLRLEQPSARGAMCHPAACASPAHALVLHRHSRGAAAGQTASAGVWCLA